MIRLPRTARLLWRHVRYNPLLLGASHREAVARQLGRLFVTTNAFLRETGVDYWLAFGTLLGQHREGQIIRGDVDVDFGLRESDYTRVKKAASRLPPGFRLQDTSARHLGPKLYVEWDGWEADLYFYRAEQSWLLPLERGTFPGERSKIPDEFVFPLQSATFLGQETWLPARPRELLEHHYGYLGSDAVRDRATGYFVRQRN
ncbi:MAG: hypothetical protein AMXMBFR33_13370 [Candidatus Xenobia bacterium]